MLDMLDFLEEKERNKLYILQFLEVDDNMYYPFSNMMSTLSLSKFKLENLLSELQSDINHHQPNSQATIQIENGIYIFYTNITQDLIIELKHDYIQNSMHFSLFLEILVNKINIPLFSEKNFLSNSKGFSIQKRLTYILKKHKIKLKNATLFGNEISIRLLYFDVFVYFFSGKSTVFEKNSTIQTLVSEITPYLSDELSPSEKVKLLIFIGVSHFRQSNRFYIKSKSNQSYDILSSPFINIYSHLITPRNMEVSYAESVFLHNFLYSENLIPYEHSLLSKEQLIETEELSQEFNFFLSKSTLFNSISTNQEIKDSLDNLKIEIKRINFKWLFFKTTTSSFISLDKVRYFEEVFPEYYFFLENFFKKSKCSLLKIENTSIFYDYIFAIITSFPISLINKPIYICIDFYRGSSYTKFLSQNVLNFTSMNIILQKSPDINTHIYISDYRLQSLTCTQIIWKEPPSSKDWRILGDIMVRERKEL